LRARLIEAKRIEEKRGEVPFSGRGNALKVDSDLWVVNGNIKKKEAGTEEGSGRKGVQKKKKKSGAVKRERKSE